MSADEFLFGDSRDGAGSAALRQQVTQLFEELRDPVYRQCLRITGNPEESEDITQEVFIRLFGELRARRPVEYPRAWLLRSAHNLAIDRMRSARNVRPFEESEDANVADGRQGTEGDLLQQERRQRILNLLDELSPQERRCMELRTEGLRYREIAETLGVRVSTVETNLARAVKKLMEKLNA